MEVPKELDPRVLGFKRTVQLVGVAAIAAAASGVVIVGALSWIAACAVGTVALGMTYFVPVAGRRMALWKQSTLTKLAEEFSEETIREDERLEGERVAEQQRLFTTQSAEIGNIIDELRLNLSTATDDERNQVQGQIDQLDTILENAEIAVRGKVDALAELKRVNKLYVSFHRAARVLKSSQDLDRNAQQIQQVETARNAIKTSMREAVAGQKLEAMNAPLRERLSVSKVAQIASSPTETLQQITTKEKVNVPNRR
jgi:hypothetical protein